MMRLYFPDLHDLAVAALKSDAGMAKYDEASGEKKKDVQQMYDALMSGSADFFIHKDKPTDNGKSLISVWTRSSRGYDIQHTVWLCYDREKKVMSLSHDNITGAEELWMKAEPDGYVEGVSLADGDRSSYEDLFLNLCEPDA